MMAATYILAAIGVFALSRWLLNALESWQPSYTHWPYVKANSAEEAMEKGRLAFPDAERVNVLWVYEDVYRIDASTSHEAERCLFCGQVKE